MTWWWDNWVHPYNLYSEFRSVANYVDGIDCVDENVKPVESTVTPKEGNVVNLTILPVKGWADTSVGEFTVNRDGSVVNISELSSFVHGDYHRMMSPNPTFYFSNVQAASFGIEINTIARAGSNLIIKVNQKEVLEQVFSSSNRDYLPETNIYEVALPAGENTVEVINNGPDWINVERYWITNYAERIRSYARGNSTKALVWVHDSTHQFASIDAYDPDHTIVPTDITLASMEPGEYQVEEFDPYSGNVIATQILLVSNNRLLFPVSALRKDTAFRITAKASQIQQSNKY
jgi:hypothetical protein